jgi:predicted RNA methylase
MDRSILEKHLAIAQQHVIEGMDHLAQQEQIVAELERDGHDTVEALKILAMLRDTQKLHEQEVQRITMVLKQQIGQRPGDQAD